MDSQKCDAANEAAAAGGATNAMSNNSKADKKPSSDKKIRCRQCARCVGTVVEEGADAEVADVAEGVAVAEGAAGAKGAAVAEGAAGAGGAAVAEGAAGAEGASGAEEAAGSKEAAVAEEATGAEGVAGAAGVTGDKNPVLIKANNNKDVAAPNSSVALDSQSGKTSCSAYKLNPYAREFVPSWLVKTNASESSSNELISTTSSTESQVPIYDDEYKRRHGAFPKTKSGVQLEGKASVSSERASSSCSSRTSSQQQLRTEQYFAAGMPFDVAEHFKNVRAAAIANDLVDPLGKVDGIKKILQERGILANNKQAQADVLQIYMREHDLDQANESSTSVYIKKAAAAARAEGDTGMVNAKIRQDESGSRFYSCESSAIDMQTASDDSQTQLKSATQMFGIDAELQKAAESINSNIFKSLESFTTTNKIKITNFITENLLLANQKRERQLKAAAKLKDMMFANAPKDDDSKTLTPPSTSSKAASSLATKSYSLAEIKKRVAMDAATAKRSRSLQNDASTEQKKKVAQGKDSMRNVKSFNALSKTQSPVRGKNAAAGDVCKGDADKGKGKGDEGEVEDEIEIVIEGDDDNGKRVDAEETSMPNTSEKL